MAALRALLVAPDPDPQVVAALEALLGDHTPTILSFPIRLGEVRWLAAEVLAATRARCDERLHEPVVLDPGYPTLTPSELGALAKGAGAPEGLDPPGRYAWLRDHGKLAPRRLEFHPRMYLE